MRITKNTQDSICHLCHEPIKKGELAANYSATLATIRRGHPKCVEDWTRKQVAEYVGNRYKKGSRSKHAKAPSDIKSNTACENV